MTKIVYGGIILNCISIANFVRGEVYPNSGNSLNNGHITTENAVFRHCRLTKYCSIMREKH